MVANLKSRSPQANPATPPPPVPLPNTWQSIGVTFNASANPKFTFNPSPDQDSAKVALYNFILTSSSDEGSSFSGLSIGPEAPGGNAPPWFSSPATPYYKEVGVANFWVTVQTDMISVTIQDENFSKNPTPISLILTVSDSKGNPHNSPDPQIVLVPR